MDPSNYMDENWNMVGHAWAVDMLRHQVSRAETRQAYLFTGPPGIGRRTLALRFAQALNCSTPTAPGLPCGRCYHCTQLENDISNLLLKQGAKLANGHPDLRAVHPVPAKLRPDEEEQLEGRLDLRPDRENLALKVSQVRRANRSVSLKPYAAQHRILIFVRFETATDEAGNALLKTLEEAPPHAVLMLTAESPEGLLPTIVSRCEVLRLHPVPLDAVQRWLEQRGAGTEQARLLAHVSGGCPGEALRLMEDKGALAYRGEKLNELLALLPATRAQRFSYAEKLVRDKAAMRGVLMLWLSFWRDVLWRAGGASTPISNIDHQQEIESLSRRLTLPDATRLVEDLDLALRRLESNINSRLLAEVLLLDWPR